MAFLITLVLPPVLNANRRIKILGIGRDRSGARSRAWRAAEPVKFDRLHIDGKLPFYKANRQRSSDLAEFGPFSSQRPLETGAPRPGIAQKQPGNGPGERKLSRKERQRRYAVHSGAVRSTLTSASGSKRLRSGTSPSALGRLRQQSKNSWLSRVRNAATVFLVSSASFGPRHTPVVTRQTPCKHGKGVRHRQR